MDTPLLFFQWAFQLPEKSTGNHHPLSQRLTTNRQTPDRFPPLTQFHAAFFYKCLSLSPYRPSAFFSSSLSYIMEENRDPLARRVPSFAQGKRILLVDRDASSLTYISSVLESHSYKGKSKIR